MEKLLKATASFGSTELALIIVAVIRNKYLAIEIGPEGYGMFSILDSFFSLFLAFSGGWLAHPAMKYIAELRSKKQEDSIQNVLNFTFSVTFFTSLFFVSVFFIFSNFFLNNFLSSEITFTYYALFAASFLGTSLSSIMQSYFQGMLLIKETIFRKIVLRIFDLVSVIILVLLFGLLGFFINVLVVAFFGLFIFIYKSKANRPKIEWPMVKDEIIKKVITFGGINMFIGILNLLSIYLQRILVIKFLDIASLGLYRAALTFSGYLGIVGNSSMFFVNSKANEVCTLDDRNKQLNDYLKFVLFTSILFFVPGILFTELAINILYSKQFLGLSPVLYIFIIAQFLLSIQLGIQAQIIGLERLKLYTIVTTIAYATIVLIPFFFLKSLNILSLGIASISASLIQITVLGIHLKRKFGIGLSRFSFRLICISSLLLLSSYLLMNQHIVWKTLFVFLNIIIMYIQLPNLDRDRIKQKVNSLLIKVKK